MKIIQVSFIFLCLCILHGYAQDNVLYQSIQQSKSFGEKFEPVAALAPAGKSATQKRRVEEHFNHPQEVYFLHYSRLAAKNLNASMTLSIPLGGKTLQLELQEFHMEYQVETSSGLNMPYNPNIRHYHGVVKGDSTSIAAITFAEDEIIGLVATDEGNFNIALDRVSGAHIFYNDKNLKQQGEFGCATEIDGFPDAYTPEVLLENTRGAVTQKYIQLHLETEYDIFQQCGNTIMGVEIYISGLFSQVALLYRNESINVKLSCLYIWNTNPSGYPYTSIIIDGLLNQFQNYRIPLGYEGDIAQLVTFKELFKPNFTSAGDVSGLSGFEGLCNADQNRRLSVARIQNTYHYVPTFSASVYAVAHELGHLLGSEETHSCAWNGKNTAIDGCATPSGCTDPGNPSPAGTIMSYCYYKPGVGVNFNLGFGPQPGDRIRNFVANATCILSITGSDIICYGSPKTFTATNWKSSNYYWTYSSNLSLTSYPPFSTATVSAANSSSSGPGWVGINDSYGIELARINVWVGTVNSLSISGTSYTNPSSSYGHQFIANSSPALAPNTLDSNAPSAQGLGTVNGYEWKLSPAYSGRLYNYGSYANIYFEDEAYFQITLRGHNACGAGSWAFKYVDVSNYSPSPSYPNPVSEILTIETGTSNAKAQGANLTYDVRLYDGQGNLLRQASNKGGTIEFNVSALPDGIYYLHIYDGVNSTPEMQQIVVEH